MPNQELVDYIKSQIAKGVDLQSLTAELVGKGWTQEQITESLSPATESKNPPISQVFVSPSMASPSLDEEIPVDKRMYPNQQIPNIQDPSRFLAFPILGGLIRSLAWFPLFIGFYFVLMGWGVVVSVNSLVVLITGKYWVFAYKYTMVVVRYQTKLDLYLFGLVHKYPGISSMSSEFTLEHAYPETSSRLFAIPIISFIVRFLLIFPYMIWVIILCYGAWIAAVAASFPVLFSKKYPESCYEFIRDSLRVRNACLLYLAGVSDTYPSFSISWNHKVIKIILIIIGALWTFYSIYSGGAGYSTFESVKNPSLSSLTPQKQQEISTQLGFKVLVPPSLPKEYSFEDYEAVHAVSTTRQTHLNMGFKKGVGTQIIVSEEARSPGKIEKLRDLMASYNPIRKTILSFPAVVITKPVFSKQPSANETILAWEDDKRYISLVFTPAESFTESDINTFVSALYGVPVVIATSTDPLPTPSAVPNSSAPILSPTPIIATPTPTVIPSLIVKDAEEFLVEKDLVMHLKEALFQGDTIRIKVMVKNTSSGAKVVDLRKIQVLGKISPSVKDLRIPSEPLETSTQITLPPGVEKDIELTYVKPDQALYPYLWYYYPQGSISVFLGAAH